MGIATHETSHEKAVAQIEERRRAEARAKLCKSRVSREPIPGKPDAHTVRVDGREVGLLRKHSGGSWTAVYLLDGADRIVADDDSQRRALHRLKVEVMLEDERRVAAQAGGPGRPATPPQDPPRQPARPRLRALLNMSRRTAW